MYILLMLTMGSVISITLVKLIMINIGWLEYDSQKLVFDVMFNAITTGGFSLVFLICFLRRYRDLHSLKQSFEQQLTAQNDLIEARLAPHFFFNTINTLISLIESNPPRAADLLQHVSALFRASFNGDREISFEEEVALCEHYLAIESIRLGDKLAVNWQLPDEDVMYDMVITALILQSVLEKILLNVVEMTTETIYIDIVVIWQQHRVAITVTAELPIKTLMISHDLQRQLDFYIQAERLRANFGHSATVQTTVTSKQVITNIDYPLQDVSL